MVNLILFLTGVFLFFYFRKQEIESFGRPKKLLEVFQVHSGIRSDNNFSAKILGAGICGSYILTWVFNADIPFISPVMGILVFPLIFITAFSFLMLFLSGIFLVIR